MQTMTTKTTEAEVRACLERGVWYELVDPETGEFWGRWLDPRGPEPFRERHFNRTGRTLQVCLVKRLSPKDQLPLQVRVTNLERPGWRGPWRIPRS